MSTTKPPTLRRKVLPKVFGYALDPVQIFDEAVKNGTVVLDPPDKAYTAALNEFFNFVSAYKSRVVQHCGTKLISVYPDRRRLRAPVYCIVAASNRNAATMVPQTDIIDKAKTFLNTTEDPKWYYVCLE